MKGALNAQEQRLPRVRPVNSVVNFFLDQAEKLHTACLQRRAHAAGRLLGVRGLGRRSNPPPAELLGTSPPQLSAPHTLGRAPVLTQKQADSATPHIFHRAAKAPGSSDAVERYLVSNKNEANDRQ